MCCFYVSMNFRNPNYFPIPTHFKSPSTSNPNHFNSPISNHFKSLPFEIWTISNPQPFQIPIYLKSSTISNLTISVLLSCSWCSSCFVTVFIQYNSLVWLDSCNWYWNIIHTRALMCIVSERIDRIHTMQCKRSRNDFFVHISPLKCALQCITSIGRFLTVHLFAVVWFPSCDLVGL